MERFDNIDIFFIAIIGAYFITLACIILSFIIIGIKKLIKNKKVKNLKPVLPIIEQTIQIPQEEIKYIKAKKDKNKKPKLTNDKQKESKAKSKPINENIPVTPRHKLSEIAIIQKLFMKKVTPKIKSDEDKNSIKLETTQINNNNIITETKKLKTTVLSDKVHVNTSKYNTGETLEKQKSALENVIEQINKDDNKEVLEKKKVEEKALSEIIVNITKEDKEKKADISLVEKTESETKTKKDTTSSDKITVVKDNSKTKLPNDNKDRVNKEKEAITTTNSSSSKTKNNTNKGNSHKANSKNTNTKQKNNNTKKSNKNNTKRKKNSSNKKKTTNTKGKKNTKKKNIKRKKS